MGANANVRHIRDIAHAHSKVACIIYYLLETLVAFHYNASDVMPPAEAVATACRRKQ